MERETRLELATSSLARKHSTTELFPQIHFAYSSYLIKKNNQVVFLKYCKHILRYTIINEQKKYFLVLKYVSKAMGAK